jgi:hypothetical protein
VNKSVSVWGTRPGSHGLDWLGSYDQNARRFMICNSVMVVVDWLGAE